jgi:hypothetical protein
MEVHRAARGPAVPLAPRVGRAIWRMSLRTTPRCCLSSGSPALRCLRSASYCFRWRIIPNTKRSSRTVGAPAVNRLDNPTDREQSAICHGQQAWHRLRHDHSWADWTQVGAAVVIGRSEAMREAAVNRPVGRRYNVLFAAWLKQFDFENLDKADRSRLFAVMDHLEEIETWRATLTPAQRLHLNHPSAVLRIAPATAAALSRPSLASIAVAISSGRSAGCQRSQATGSQSSRKRRISCCSALFSCRHCLIGLNLEFWFGEIALADFHLRARC